MNKMTNLLKEDTKKEYDTVIDIMLESGIVLEAKIKLTDFNESFVKESIQKNINGSKIVSVKMKNIVEK